MNKTKTTHIVKGIQVRNFPNAPPKAGERPGLKGCNKPPKSKLKTAKIVAAERVPDAKKLLKLQLEVGSEKRQIVSGIAESYSPEELIGKTIIIVSNLQSATIRGVESAGMLLAAGKGDKIRLATFDGDVPSGIDVG
jgi:methionyl-tRNA synthetase